jgi:GNAT superfamily N-acetyltransferase
MPVIYALEPELCAKEFREILIASTLAKRRPVDEPEYMELMLRNADVILTARDEGRLVGVSRAITDFAYCCFLSDLAVDSVYQHRGIGKRLIRETHITAGIHTNLYLVSAPAAEGYYPKIGMKNYSCWGLPRHDAWDQMPPFWMTVAS